VKNKVRLSIEVHPRSRKQGMEKKGSGEYKICVLSAPSKGEANKEVIEIISFYFGVPRSCIQIIRGHRSRHKSVILEVDDVRDLCLQNIKMEKELS